MRLDTKFKIPVVTFKIYTVLYEILNSTNFSREGCTSFGCFRLFAIFEMGGSWDLWVVPRILMTSRFISNSLDF